MTFPQCNFSLEIPKILGTNLIGYHRLSVSGNSEVMHCGILINKPYRDFAHSRRFGVNACCIAYFTEDCDMYSLDTTAQFA